MKKYKTPRSCSNNTLEGFVDHVRHRQNDSFSLRVYQSKSNISRSLGPQGKGVQYSVQRLFLASLFNQKRVSPWLSPWGRTHKSSEDGSENTKWSKNRLLNFKHCSEKDKSTGKVNFKVIARGSLCY